MVKIKHRCDKCSEFKRNTVVYKGQELCRRCYHRVITKCGCGSTIPVVLLGQVIK